MRRFSHFAVVVVFGVAACSSSSSPSGKGKKDEPPPPPCHPGCFPAGTVVATPGGPRAIEAIRSGDVVTLVGPDGTPTSRPVHSTFETCNRLVEVRTDAGNLLTTETQPLCLRDGGFRPAGELAEGDVIWRWEAGERQPAQVRSVVQTGRDVSVFNLIVGESAIFVADGFLARGKPPVTGAAGE